MKVLPAFEIRRDNTTHLKGLNDTGYLFGPELVQFHVTLPNVSYHQVHLAEQGLVL
jgi:hypothetical protein